MEYQLKNDCLEAAVRSMGAEVVSLKRGGQEFIWQRDEAFWGRSSPVLFPFVGSLKGKAYRYEGKTYAMGQHGFARDMEFEIVSRTDTALTMALTESKETLAKYPFRFRLEISYVLQGNCLTVGWRVLNTGDKALPFSIGAHPAFYCPLRSGEKQSDYRLRFLKDGKALSEVSTSVLSGGLIVEGERTYGLHDGFLAITPDLFETDTLILENKQADTISLFDARRREYIRVSFDMPLAAVWTPIEKHAPFVCIEPWCGRCDGADFEGELPERKWGNLLDVGGEFLTSYTIEVL